MERIKAMALARTILGATVCVLALIGWSGAALASPPSVTLSGSGDKGGFDYATAYVNVNATLSQGIVSGTLESQGSTGGSPSHGDREFNGNVTCMVVHGNRVTLGAFGTVWSYYPPTKLPGNYAQVLTVEFGKFPIPDTQPPRFVTDSFGLLGEYVEGLPSTSPPSCYHASFSNQILPVIAGAYPGGVIDISPSITSPRDGHVSRDGTVTLKGTGEPNRAIKVYEVGNEASATEVTANDNGKWSLTLSGLSVGKHVFTALAVGGSTVPANTVEVEVPPPHHHR
jgi:hypothetical protein